MKFTDKELIDYLEDFLEKNDQLPTHKIIADHFKVVLNAVNERLRKLEKNGVLMKNSANKYMFRIR